MNVFESLGVPRVINAVGPATRLGGVALHPDVIEAMRQAVRAPVRLDELQERAGDRIADLLGVEAAYITSGAAAGLTLATAVALARDDAAAADQLPDSRRIAAGVVVQAAHRDPYDRAIELAGGRIVPVGYPRSTHAGELERALDDGAVAVLHRPGRPGNLVSLRDAARAAHERGALAIVDGALHAPPASALRGFFEDGADLVAMSGGKQLRGPQASGILCGRRELVQMVGVHHQDMDERIPTWRRNTTRSLSATPPRHGVARGMKVGREQICGLVAAVERYVESPGRDDLTGITQLTIAHNSLVERLDPAQFTVRWIDETSLGVPEVAVSAPGLDLDEFVRLLAIRKHPICVEESEIWRGAFTLNPMALLDGDGLALADGIAETIGDAALMPRAAHSEEHAHDH